ncbi:uncharacterized protein LOC132277947 [Cornus florida]|uniref:uncharacterized protein LOC132277947 n=1 Tax=Cornus florida TaxID=4283 RepID=UPI002899E757|nr:uncharacterized protein LOC132277947 [Cornus florida]
MGLALTVLTWACSPQRGCLANWPISFLHGIREVKDPFLMADTEAPNSNEQGLDNDLHDPFFVHHSDNPTTVFVSPLLTEDNFTTWLCAMRMALRAKNKFGFVDGTLKPPTDVKELQQWQRYNDLVSSWILNSTDSESRASESRASVLYAESQGNMA